MMPDGLWSGTSDTTSWMVSLSNLANGEGRGSLHDDATAQHLGFAGGLVPGVVLLAHALSGPGDPGDVEGAGMELRAEFIRPTYDGDVLAFGKTANVSPPNLEVKAVSVSSRSAEISPNDVVFKLIASPGIVSATQFVSDITLATALELQGNPENLRPSLDENATGKLVAVWSVEEPIQAMRRWSPIPLGTEHVRSSKILPGWLVSEANRATLTACHLPYPVVHSACRLSIAGFLGPIPLHSVTFVNWVQPRKSRLRADLLMFGIVTVFIQSDELVAHCVNELVAFPTAVGIGRALV